MDKPNKSNLTQDPARTKLEEQPTPSTTPAPTTAAAPAAPAVKLVKIKALRDTQVRPDLFIKAGDEGEVTEAEAAWLCKPRPGHFNFVGYREPGEEAPGTFQRCVRL